MSDAVTMALIVSGGTLLTSIVSAINGYITRRQVAKLDGNVAGLSRHINGQMDRLLQLNKDDSRRAGADEEAARHPPPSPPSPESSGKD